MHITIMEWIQLNYKWIFDGIGVAIVSAIIAIIRFVYHRREKKRLPIPPPIKELTKPNYTQQVSSRLQETVHLVNESLLADVQDPPIITAMFGEHDKLDLPTITELTGYQHVSQIERYFSGIEEPTLRFLDLYSDAIGVNPNWLKFGKDNTFKITDGFQNNMPEVYYDKIIVLQPKMIYLVRNQDPPNQVAIILRINKWKYIYLNQESELRVSSKFGDGGAARLFSFYKLLLKIKENNMLYISCHINEASFERLTQGVIYPGFLSVGSGPERDHPYTKIKFSAWGHDLVNYDETIESYYLNHYGEEFILAHRVIQRFL